MAHIGCRDDDDSPACGLKRLTSQVITLSLDRVAFVLPPVVFDQDLPLLIDQIAPGKESAD